MAEENTQLPYDSTESDSHGDEPLGVPSHLKRKDGTGSIETVEAAMKGEATSPPSIRWKRGVLSPKVEKDSPSAELEPGAELEDSTPWRATTKAAKRIKTREEPRKANDLMECFRARASTAAGSSCDVKKRPATSASSDPKKTYRLVRKKSPLPPEFNVEVSATGAPKTVGGFFFAPPCTKPHFNIELWG